MSKIVKSIKSIESAKSTKTELTFGKSVKLVKPANPVKTELTFNKSAKSAKSIKKTNNQLIKIATLTKEEYSKLDTWYEYFESGKDLMNIRYDLSWCVMFSKLMSNPKYVRLNDNLKDIVKKNNNIKIYPHPSHLMASFIITKASDLKVVFIGQDPYFNCEYIGDKFVPQAMGLSFSVPNGFDIPSSLGNIQKNMIKFGHLKEKSANGNLWFWATQGCLMLNAILTVVDSLKGGHAKLWEWFTDYIIQYISQYMDNIIFVLWGSYAYEKISMIDLDKHHVIISSHPSGLSANKPFKDFPAFMDEDTFGKINTTLKKIGKTRIMWD